MRILVEGESVTVAEPDDLGRLHLELTGTSAEAASAALARAGLGRIDDTGHARIDADALRSLAEPVGASEDWRRRWTGMLDYARSKGWLDDSGQIRVHLA
ncbi:hypothetical protein [Saccharopolyspora flava]|uniref:Uncharacterized protein n=1 Tax=Saccharopolyspora flava TaxID=95161 RepID=A0A1I6V2F0_9PSEU|nr:hypothetical protein [Saccharopolyspora flava]SFT07863.1 hypothetical protein SAMN05660874_05519 [Saccharopolyspora flava]